MTVSKLLRGRCALALVALCIATLPTAKAGGGLLGLDHPVALDDKGIWARRNQVLLLDALLAGEVGAGLWEGGETRFGHTIWQSIDATLVSGAAAQALKFTFTRERPNQTNNPDRWFTGHGNASFPSGEVTVASSIVTPLILSTAPIIRLYMHWRHCRFMTPLPASKSMGIGSRMSLPASCSVAQRATSCTSGRARRSSSV